MQTLIKRKLKCEKVIIEIMDSIVNRAKNQISGILYLRYLNMLCHAHLKTEFLNPLNALHLYLTFNS